MSYRKLDVRAMHWRHRIYARKLSSWQMTDRPITFKYKVQQTTFYYYLINISSVMLSNHPNFIFFRVVAKNDRYRWFCFWSRNSLPLFLHCFCITLFYCILHCLCICWMIIGEEYGQCHKPMHCRPGEQHSRGNDSVRARVGRSLLLAYIGVKNMCPVRDSSRRMSLALTRWLTRAMCICR